MTFGEVIRADANPIPNIAFFFNEQGVGNYDTSDPARIARDFAGFTVNGMTPVGSSANGGGYIELMYPENIGDGAVYEVIPHLCSIFFDDNVIHPVEAKSGSIDD